MLVRSIALALSLVLIGGGVARAGDAEKKADKAERHAKKKAELLKRFDTDGDGQLSKEEKKAMHEALKKEHEAKLLERFDKDKDGKLSDEEKKAAEEAHAKHRAGGKHRKKKGSTFI